MDVITYCINTGAFVSELRESHRDWLNDDDPDNPQFLLPKAPNTIRNKNETLVMCRLTQSQIDIINNMENLTVLGTYEQVFADPEKRAIYDRVYDQTPTEITLEDGGTYLYTPPEKFVVIA